MSLADQLTAGDLIHRVTITKTVGEISDTGGVEEDADLVTVAARIPAGVVPVPVSFQGRETLRAGTKNMVVSHVVRIRFRTDVKADMALDYDGRALQILTLIDPDERHQELQLLCAEVVG